MMSGLRVGTEPLHDLLARTDGLAHSGVESIVQLRLDRFPDVDDGLDMSRAGQ